MNKIIKNATVIYKDGIKEHFDAIKITNKGVNIGRFIKNDFRPFGYIPKSSISRISNRKNYDNKY